MQIFFLCQAHCRLDRPRVDRSVFGGAAAVDPLRRVRECLGRVLSLSLSVFFFEAQQRWIHCDACESARFLSPSLPLSRPVPSLTSTPSPPPPSPSPPPPLRIPSASAPPPPPLSLPSSSRPRGVAKSCSKVSPARGN